MEEPTTAPGGAKAGAPRRNAQPTWRGRVRDAPQGGGHLGGGRGVIPHGRQLRPVLNRRHCRDGGRPLHPPPGGTQQGWGGGSAGRWGRALCRGGCTDRPVWYKRPGRRCKRRGRREGVRRRRHHRRGQHRQRRRRRKVSDRGDERCRGGTVGTASGAAVAVGRAFAADIKGAIAVGRAVAATVEGAVAAAVGGASRNVFLHPVTGGRPGRD